MLKLPGSLLARFLHPARRIAPKASCGPRRLPSSGPAPQLAPGATPPPPRPSEPAPRARLDELRSRLAQKGNFLCITICITLKFTFTTPFGEGFLPSLLESGCSARNLLIFPFHLDFILAAKTSDSLRAVGAGGGGGLFRWREGEGNIRRERGGGGGVCWKLRRSWDRRPTAPAHGWGWSELQPLPLPESSEAGYIFKKPNCKQLWRCQNSPPSDTALLRRFPQAGLFLSFALPSSATIIKALVW